MENEMWLMQDYGEFLIPFLVAIITSFLTVHLSIRQFRSQKWWETKAEAYTQIIQELSRLYYFYSEFCDVLEGTKTLSADVSKRLHTEHAEAEERISKAAAAGAFIISKQASDVLEKLILELTQKRDSHDVWDNYKSVKNCIEKIKAFAHADLKL